MDGFWSVTPTVSSTLFIHRGFTSHWKWESERAMPLSMDLRMMIYRVNNLGPGPNLLAKVPSGFESWSKPFTQRNSVSAGS